MIVDGSAHEMVHLRSSSKKSAQLPVQFLINIYVCMYVYKLQRREKVHTLLN